MSLIAKIRNKIISPAFAAISASIRLDGDYWDVSFEPQWKIFMMHRSERFGLLDCSGLRLIVFPTEASQQRVICPSWFEEFVLRLSIKKHQGEAGIFTNFALYIIHIMRIG